MYRDEPYDPWEHAHALGFTVERRALSHAGHRAECHTIERLILLRPGMTWREELCQLAHENVHAERGDLPIPEGIELRKRELLCDRTAAERLINADQLIKAMIEHHDPATWCLDLNITSRLLRVYLQQHPEVRIQAEQIAGVPGGERCGSVQVGAR